MGSRRALTVIDVEVPQLTAALRSRSSSYGRLDAVGKRDVPTRKTGQVCLIAVAVLWGTYSPAYRLIYAQPGPPQPPVLTALRASLQALLLIPPAALQASRASKKSRPASASRVPEASPLLAGLELGLYNFAASGLQAVGLQYTTATRGALLILATSIITPLLARLGGAKLAREIWLGCFLALCGAALIACDQPASSGVLSAAALGLSAGDLAVLGAAFGYSLATVRLEAWTSRLGTLQLAWAKSSGIAGYAVAWLAGDCMRRQLAGQDLGSLWPQASNGIVWAALLWSAVGPGAAAAWLQTKGQAVVPASEAQIIYSLTPIPAAAFAALLPGGAEAMGLLGYLGGALVMAASATASLAQRSGPPAPSRAQEEAGPLSRGMSNARRSISARVRSKTNLEEP